MTPLANKKLFIFDFDGTLAETLADITASVNYVRSNLGLQPLTAKEVVKHIGRGQEALVQGITTKENSQEVLRLYNEHHSQHLLDNVQYFPEVPLTIEFLHHANKKVVILSNKYSYYCQKIVNHLKPLLKFDLILGPDNIPTKKPDPSGIYLATERLQVSLSDTVMVGDSEYDINTGINAKVTTVGCLYGYGNISFLNEKADFQIGNFSEIKDLI